jgi:hypothetical protein
MINFKGVFIMRKIACGLFLVALIFVSCTKVIVGDKFWEEEKNGWTEYTWMISTGSGSGAVDRYTLFVVDNGESKLYIAHFNDMLSNPKAEKVDEKNNVKVNNIERSNGEVLSITVDNIKYGKSK